MVIKINERVTELLTNVKHELLQINFMKICKIGTKKNLENDKKQNYRLNI